MTTNPEHLEILKQGAKVWNEWRSEHFDDTPDPLGNHPGPNFNHADISGADLSHANLGHANFSHANLSYTDLSHADLSHTDLFLAILHGTNLGNAKLTGARLYSPSLPSANLLGADLGGANLSLTDLDGMNLHAVNLSGAILNGAKLPSANLSGANLSNANLSFANLRGANFRDANLSGADLGSADLSFANVSGANLTETDISGAGTSSTVFGSLDLRWVKGLERIRHLGPSELTISTLYRSQGQIPGAFLRGCGLSNWQIESAKLYRPDLSNEEINSILYRIHDLRAHQAIQVNSLFISYTHTDSPFVEKVEKYLNERGIRFWRDVHRATAGRLERQVDRAIRLNPTVLLVLSENSVQSDWVQHEARLARNLEIETNRDVLCPVALDDSWKNCKWPERLREQIMEYNILDFSEWRDENKFWRMFSRLLEGLDLFYK